MGRSGAPSGSGGPRPSPGAEREQRIVDVIRALRPGEVVSYGDIADVAGYPKQARLVGRILATSDVELPWWRVVNSAGRLVPGHEREQSALLRSEAVTVRAGHVSAAPHGRFAGGRGSGPASRAAT